MKAFVSETTDKACPGSWEEQPTSWGTAKDVPPGDKWRPRAFVFQGETDDHPPLGTADCPGQECCIFFHPVLPESQSPHSTLFIPHYKMSGLEREDKMVYLGYEPAIFSDRWPSE